jgi:sirohydrochlorin ferrochelatase
MRASGFRSDGSELVLVAHGTRHPDGIRTICELAAAVSARVGPVRTAFVDVLGPDPAEVLADIAGPAVVVPAFLASGYHVHIDVPIRIAGSGHQAVAVTRALGPDPALAEVMHARLLEAGWRPGDVVIMAAAGSSDPGARRELYSAATMLADHVGEVHLGYVATGAPRVHDVLRVLRDAGRRRIFIASYLLAPGLFHSRLHHYGTTAVAAPLGVHPGVVDLVAARFASVSVATAG